MLEALVSLRGGSQCGVVDLSLRAESAKFVTVAVERELRVAVSVAVLPAVVSAALEGMLQEPLEVEK
jgi:hypothetical protein